MHIKICGITSPETAIAASNAGADMIGLVYYPPSPRHVEVAQIHEILDAIKPFARQNVLVAVDQLPDDEIVSLFDFVQPYGEVRGALPIKQIHVIKDYKTFSHLLESQAVEATLYALEMSKGTLPGGNGVVWDWSVAKPFCERFPTLIAGGVTPENVADVIRLASPYGIDVSSGVESAPGIKDIDKIKRLVDNVRKVTIFGDKNIGDKNK